ncbi:hypothetical protein D1871_00710 [Nakamurella silvestris]|nr:hypothetical protein D1871_00710 [Nakamurella silvestris]
MTNPITAAALGVGRTLLQAGTHLAADVATATVRGAEAVGAKVSGKVVEPATLRLSVLILSDERGVPLLQPADLDPAISFASSVLETVGIRVRHVGTRTVTEPAPTGALDPRANRALLLDEFLGRNAFYGDHLRRFADAGESTDLVGRPVTAIVVRDIAGRTTGCSLGVSADWVIVQAALFDRSQPHSYDESVLVHELGHACNLPHHRSKGNLMFPSSSPPGNLRGSALTGWQGALLHANRHVVPGVTRS